MNEVKLKSWRTVMSIEDQTNAVRNMLLTEMDKSKTVVFDGLLNNVAFNSIPESLFVNYFLPCFLGNPVSDNWVMEWISIAGTPMAEVNILRDGTNEILFIVPSILNTNSLFLHKEGGDIGDIFTRYEQINSNIPGQGLNFLLQALNSKNKELLNKISFNEVNQRWYNILLHYNMVNPVGQAIEQTNSSESDYFEM